MVTTVVRPPRQARSKEAWERILAAGTDLLVTDGPRAVTVQAVCSRAQVAPTAIYARVDGMAGLFWAIYEHNLAQLRAADRKALTQAARYEAGSMARVRAVVKGLCATFEAHRDVLEPIIRYSASEERMRERGSVSSAELVEEVADLLGGGLAALDVARMLHHERIIRVLYGEAWLGSRAESDRQFRERLTRLAVTRLGIADEG